MNTQKVGFAIFNRFSGSSLPSLSAHAIKAFIGLIFFTVFLSPQRAFSAVGGGYTSGGLDGSYYANTSASGTAVLTRRDVRLDFGQSVSLSPVGSNTAAYSSLTSTNWSAVWTGRFIPRFSETYTFTYFSTDTLKVSIKPSTQSSFGAPLINQTAGPGAKTSVSYGSAFVAGQTYDIQVQFTHATGPWGLCLHWSSPSTPDEAIEAAETTGFNGESSGFEGAVSTNFFPPPSNAIPGGGPVNFDANGNPTGDFKAGPTYGTVGQPGLWLLQFTGQAQIAEQFGSVITALDGTTYTNQVVPKADSHAYNSGTNTTSVLINYNTNPTIGYDYLYLTQTQRLASGAADATGNAAGVTNLKLIRPTSPGATTTPNASNLFYQPEENIIRRFTNVRWINGMQDESTNWSARLVPSNDVIEAPYLETNSGRGSNTKYCWELLVMLSNETGKDLYLTLPVVANNDYYTKLANLIKYGSDGTNPYTSVNPSPVYPPLNPNLRVILEMGNETWNPGGPYSQQANIAFDTGTAAIANQTADGQAINYDGQAASNGTLLKRRWWTQRLVQASNCFRAVFEPTNTTTQMSRVRPIFEYQYTYSPTAYDPLQFVDSYYGKADPASTYSGTPHPVNYYIWGGGAATYFGSADQTGVQSGAGSTVFQNSDLESNQIAAGATTSTDANWTFAAGSAGSAGIYHNLPKQHIVPASFGSASTTPRVGGFDFTVGSSDICVYRLGFYNKTQTTVNSFRELRIYQVNSDGTYTEVPLVLGGGVQVNLAGQAAGSFVYDDIDAPVILSAGKEYRAVGVIYDGNNDYYDDGTTVTAPAGITINKAVSATFDPNNKGNDSSWVWSDGATGNHSFGPIDMVYATAQLSGVGWAQDAAETVDTSTSLQAAYITGNGQFSQSVNFSTTGAYAVYFNCTIPINNTGNTVKIYIDNVDITPDAHNTSGQTPNSGGFFPSGGFNRNSPNRWGIIHFPDGTRPEDAWSTIPFEIGINGSTLGKGPHTIKFVGQGTADQAILLDNLRITSAQTILDNIPNVGAQNGAPSPNGSYAQGINSEMSFAQSYGLNGFAYESGISLGGDNFANQIEYYVKHTQGVLGPQMSQKVEQWLDIVSRAGVKTNTLGTYESWDGGLPYNKIDQDPLIVGFDTYNGSQLPAEASNGTIVPNNLTSGNETWDSGNGTNLPSAPSWASWNIIVGQYNTFSVAVNSSSNSSVRALVDGTPVTLDGTGKVSGLALTKGLHTIRIQDTGSSSVTISSVAVSTTKGPAGAPVLSPAVDGDGQVSLSWSAVSGATGYRVYQATATGAYTPAYTDVGNTTSAVVQNLTDGTQYYFEVRAYNASGDSLPSNEVSTVPLANNELATLVSYDLTSDSNGYQNNIAPTVATSRITSGNLVQGPGVESPGHDYTYPTTFSLYPTGDVWPANVAAVSSATNYAQFSVGPVTNGTISLNSLKYYIFAEGGVNNVPTAINTCITYSLDGGTTFSSPVIAPYTGGEVNNLAGTLQTIDLSGISALQATTHSVIIRIYVYGVNTYNFGGLGRVNDHNGILLRGSFNVAGAATPAITSSATSLNVNEGSTATFHVGLASAPASNVVVNVGIAGDPALTIGPSSITMTPSSYQNQTVTVSSATYNSSDTNHTATVTLSAPGTTNVTLTANEVVTDTQTAANLTGTPSALSGVNIGANSAGGATVRASGNWWVDGSGAGGLTGSADSFHFEQSSVTGDFSMKVNLQALVDSGGTLSRTGLMIRDGSGAGANFIALAGTTLTSNAGYKLITRTTVNGASTETTTSGTNMTYTYPNAWLCLARVGTALHAYVSSDNVTYYEVTPTAGVTWSGISNALSVGVFSSSGQTGVNARAVLSGFTIQLPSVATVNYSTGFTSTGLTLNGGTTIANSRLHLTDAGWQARSAFYSTPVNVQSFTNDFSFQLTSPTADGFTFTIQNNNATQVGQAGGGLGYAGIANSVAVKFDLYNNSGEGSNSTGVFTGGANPYTPASDLTSSGVDLHSGDIFNVHMTYDGTNLVVTITDSTNSAKTFTLTKAINIPTTVGGNTAYIGFTAGTGGAGATQEIINWTYSSSAAASNPALSVSTTSISVGDGGSANFNASLASAPASNTTVNVTLSGPSTLTVSPATILFTPTSYQNVPVTVTSSGVNPNDSNRSGTVTLAYGSQSATVSVSNPAADAQSASNLTGTAATLSGLNIGSNSAGDATVRASGNWWVDGSGAVGLSGSADSFHFEQNSVTGDFSMYVNLRVLADSGGTLSRAGLMVRDGSGAGANFIAIAGTTATANTGYKLITRTTVNAVSTETTTSGANMTYTYPNAWLCLARVGTALHAYVSSDNSNYYEVTPTAGVTWSGISNSLSVGVFSSSGQTGVNARAVTSAFQIDLPTAGVPSFSTGFTSTGLTLNNGAALNGTRLRLTDTTTGSESRSAFYSTPVNIQAFTTDFSFQLTNPNADGFTFTIQNNNATQVGQSGGGLGYAGINNSLAIKFDLYSNNGEGTDSTGFYINGANPYTPAIDLTSSGVDLHSGDIFNVHVSYDGSTLTLTITDATNSAKTYTTTYAVNIPGTVGGNTAYVGFTAGTGGLTATQEIINWTYSNPSAGPNLTDADIGGPSPAGSASLASGVYTIKGGGADIWGTSDQFNFDSEPATGDHTIITEVTSITNTSSWAKSGVMFRDSSGAGAVFVDLTATESNGVAMQWRSATNGGCSNTQVAVPTPTSTNPVWLKLVKSGSNYTGYYSLNGTSWNLVGSTTVTLTNSSYLLGLAVTAHDGTNTLLNTSTFTNTSIQ